MTNNLISSVLKSDCTLDAPLRGPELEKEPDLDLYKMTNNLISSVLKSDCTLDAPLRGPELEKEPDPDLYETLVGGPEFYNRNKDLFGLEWHVMRTSIPISRFRLGKTTLKTLTLHT